MKNIEPFKIIEIATETTNDSGKAAQDLGKLWEKFFTENIIGKIPNKKSDEIYSIYTDYESNYKGKYTCVIGLKVDSLTDIPEDLVGREFKGGEYLKFIAKGEMPKAVQDTWQEIWAKDETLNRSYTADFEVYDEKSQLGENSEVEIFIAVS
ncbi:hypothetical protein Aeqsu_2737 [Aequorivita sublithincola DSM 14238]|uniref:AraC effector-binding domain-containing protein n=1 Tax=Aequorivita sublithincola (strain DSM 14238 / LMG 21431 / ACAM 643 / 9-3) TaxID=746697 RepID=I3YYX0_AEQSU|nr:GyrI-like domain-containing protein [Aequorivita sublithincola]AFL82188.1 hypothetical protein Aeqsu_2737 [Aequorivita sublithincola DSM 14238]